MTDHETHDEQPYYDGGSAADGEQAYGGSPAAPQPPAADLPPFATGDILVAGPAAPKRRLAPVLTSIAVVAAIVVGGGAYTAVKLLASKGSQPDKWAPANSIAFAKLDLDPSASAKVAAWEFEKKFPGAPKIASSDQLKDGLLDSAFSDGGGDVNYATDIKPWLGDRVAFDVFLDSDGKPQVIDILQVKDAAKAAAGLTKLTASDSSDGSGLAADSAQAFSIQSGYAIVGPSQAVVDEAIAAAKQANIGSNSTYNSDVATLNSNRVVTVWWDAGATLKAMGNYLPGGDSSLLPGALSGLSGGLSGLSDSAKAGRLVVGLRVQPSYAELQGRVIGSSSPTTLKDGNAGAALGDLPGGTVAGISLANPGQLVKTELDAVKGSQAGPGVQNEMDQLSAQLGISVPDDIENLLGSELAIGLDSIPGDYQDLGQLFVTAVTHPDDLPKALQTAKTLIASAGSDTDATLNASSSGSSLIVTDDSRPVFGTLSDDPAFKAALGGMPSKAVAAGYVNLSTFIAAQSDAPSALSPLQSVGFYVGTDSTSPVFAVRLTVK